MFSAIPDFQQEYLKINMKTGLPQSSKKIYFSVIHHC